VPRKWLFFWNKATRSARTGAGVGHPTDADIWVPYVAGQLTRGDSIYCVAVDRGELLPFGRLIAGRLNVDAANAESLDVWAEADSDVWVLDGQAIPTR